MFYVGLAVLVVGLVLPARAGQTPGERLRNLAGHLPLLRWLRPTKRSPDEESGAER